MNLHFVLNLTLLSSKYSIRLCLLSLMIVSSQSVILRSTLRLPRVTDFIVVNLGHADFGGIDQLIKEVAALSSLV
jgi:hypothetical protein